MQVQLSNKSVKFTFQQEIRRFTLTPEIQSLQGMIQTIRNLIHQDEMPLVIKYLDDENEWVTIDRDIEFQTAMQLSEGILRIDVSERSGDVPVSDESSEVVEDKCRGRGNGRGRGRCGRGRKHFRNETAEEVESTYAESNDTVDSEPNWSRKGRGGRGQGKGRGRGGKGRGRGCRKFEEETTSSESETVDPTLTVEEIKAQIQKLVDSQEVVYNNLEEAHQKMVNKKAEIALARKNPEVTGEQIAALRAEMVELKTAKFAVKASLGATKREIFQLRKALRAKKTSTEV
jgi:DNA-binding transcriptional regulator YiaG